MKMIKLVLLIIYAHEILSLKTYYVIPGSYSDENKTETTVNISWADICHHISRYFTSRTEIILNPGIYYMEKELAITRVQNFSITGISFVTIICTSDAAICIDSSRDVRIQNVKFVNCGAKYHIPNHTKCHSNNQFTECTLSSLVQHNI